MTQQDLIAAVRTAAEKVGVDPDLAVSIAMAESDCRWPKSSTRYEPRWEYFLTPEKFAAMNGISVETEKREQATSFGPMHIMGSVARELGFTGALPELFQPGMGIFYGCQKLLWLSKRYENEASLIAAYNAGSPKKFPGGKYVNQPYVDKVMVRLNALRKFV